MDEVIQRLENVVTNLEKRVDSLSWKVKQFERMLFSDKPHSCKLMSMMSNLTVACHKFDEVVSLLAVQKNEQIAYTDTLQLQVNLVKSKVETLRALITKGRTIEF